MNFLNIQKFEKPSSTWRATRKVKLVRRVMNIFWLVVLIIVLAVWVLFSVADGFAAQAAMGDMRITDRGVVNATEFEDYELQGDEIGNLRLSRVGSGNIIGSALVRGQQLRQEFCASMDYLGEAKPGLAKRFPRVANGLIKTAKVAGRCWEFNVNVNNKVAYKLVSGQERFINQITIVGDAMARRVFLLGPRVSPVVFGFSKLVVESGNGLADLVIGSETEFVDKVAILEEKLHQGVRRPLGRLIVFVSGQARQGVVAGVQESVGGDLVDQMFGEPTVDDKTIIFGQEVTAGLAEWYERADKLVPKRKYHIIYNNN